MTKFQPLQRRRPRQARSQATVDSILQAAVQILQRAGAAGFNTNSVAERAGVSIGTLYQYFPDKEAILLAVARRELDKPDTGFAALPKILLEALIRAVEGLLGKGGASRPRHAARRMRAALTETVNTAPERIERHVLNWLMPLPARVPIRVRR